MTLLNIGHGTHHFGYCFLTGFNLPACSRFERAANATTKAQLLPLYNPFWRPSTERRMRQAIWLDPPNEMCSSAKRYEVALIKCNLHQPQKRTNRSDLSSARSYTVRRLQEVQPYPKQLSSAGCSCNQECPQTAKSADCPSYFFQSECVSCRFKLWPLALRIAIRLPAPAFLLSHEITLVSQGFMDQG